MQHQRIPTTNQRCANLVDGTEREAGKGWMHAYTYTSYISQVCLTINMKRGHSLLIYTVLQYIIYTVPQCNTQYLVGGVFLVHLHVRVGGGDSVL